MADPAFWRVASDEALRRVTSTPDGLTASEAAARLARDGPNVIAEIGTQSFLWAFLLRFRNPLILILLAAAAISAITGDGASLAIIGVVVLFSTLIDTVQEHRAGQAAARLKASVAVTAEVMRDGQALQMRVADLVVGDVVHLAAGDVVPADGLVLDARDLFVNQALLTGEAMPVEKAPLAAAPDSDALDAARNAAFMGSSVVSGGGRMLVCRTGAATQLGGIAGSLRKLGPPAALERGSHEFGMMLLRVTGLLCLFILLANLVQGHPAVEAMLFALALAVGLAPELLPMVITVTLARGALRMAAGRSVVKRLAAIHDLGAMNVLLTDKTGTLTEARISLIRTLDIDGRDTPEVLQLAWLNSHFESGVRSPLDTAILDRPPLDLNGFRKIDELPFDFERRRVSVLIDDGKRRWLVLKGAPEAVMGLCGEVGLPSGPVVPLNAAARTRAQATFDSLSAEGFRVLGIAWRAVPRDHDHAHLPDESDLVLAGFAAFLDPPKAGAGSALRELAALGVQVKVVTGDNELVARHVCGALGLPTATVLTGNDLEHLDDQALSARVGGIDVFARMSPAQKLRVLLSLKRRGHIVGFLGDGINDAPALHAADVGLSADGAIDVAKDAADIILLDKDLGVLARGIREGRRTFVNIMKYVMMATSSNFGNMVSMALAAVLLPFLPMTPVQVLLNNLLYDLSEMTIPLDRVEPAQTAQPRHWDIAFVRRFMLVFGPISSVFDLATFGVLWWGFGGDMALFRTGWFVESMATQVLVIFVIRLRGRPWSNLPHPWLVASSLGVVAFSALLPFLPIGAWFGFVPLPPTLLLTLAGLTVIYLVVVETAKRWFYAKVGNT